MPPKVQKSKAAKLLAATSASKSKTKKKKWSKGKLREKKSHRVVFNKALLDKFISEVPKKQKVITIYSLVENYKINCSLARRGIKELVNKGLVDPVQASGSYCVYTKSAKADEQEKQKKQTAKGGKEDKQAGKGGKQQQQQQKGKQQGKGKKAEKADDEEADE